MKWPQDTKSLRRLRLLQDKKLFEKHEGKVDWATGLLNGVCKFHLLMARTRMSGQDASARWHFLTSPATLRVMKTMIKTQPTQSYSGAQENSDLNSL
jgi:hypothetical protein